jgi:phosphohistidine phosphatase
MALRLILMRHAKSSWDDPAMPDAARPLNKRGRKSATAIGKWLRKREVIPAAVLSSPSQRTRETWERVAAELGAKGAVLPQPRWDDALYLAEPADMLAVLRTATGPGPVMMLGHNPGISLFAGAILERAPALAAYERYPTGATAIIDLDAPGWPQVDWGCGRLVSFVTPRELE